MKVLRYPVIIITLFFALGIAAAGFALPLSFLYALSAAAFTGFAASWWFSSRSLSQKPYFAISACVLTFCLGMLAQSLHYAPNQKFHYSRLINSGTSVIRGVVTERLKPNDFSEKYFFEVTSVNNKNASGKILLHVPKDTVAKPLHAGDVLFITDEPWPVPQSLNPYQFDYSKYMARQNVFHQLRLNDNFIAAGRVKNADYYREKITATLMGSFEGHGYSPEVMNVIKALLLGQRQDMDRETAASFTDAGVVHILAISGLHIGILFWLLSVLLKPLHRLKKGKLLQLVLILSFLWLFAFLSGLSASVVRSVVMFSFIGIGLYFNRNAGMYNSIAVSMLFLLLVKPGFLFDVGFQLSYAAVIAIVAMQPIHRKIIRSKYKVVNYITDTLFISLVAQVGVLPLTLYYFNQFPILFLPANLIAIPLSTAVLVLGIVVLALNFIYFDAARIVGETLEFLILAMNRFIKWIASFDNFIIRDISFTLLLCLALSLAIAALALWLYKPNFKRSVALLSSAIIFQCLYIATALKAGRTEELIVFNNRPTTLISVKDKNGISVISHDSLAAQSPAIKAYCKGSFNRNLHFARLQNMLWFRNTKIFILDSVGVYDSIIRPDMLLVTQSAKVNPERVLQQLKPKQVVADATNYKSHVQRWSAACRKEKIPFHATAEKGFYKIE